MLRPKTFADEFEKFTLRYSSYEVPYFENDPNFIPSLGEFTILSDDEGNILPPEGDFPLKYAESYETYSLTGEVLGAVHGLQQPEFIETFMRSFSTSITEFATALANYWSTVLIVPGVPSHGGVSVVSVVNDATNWIASFEAAILASITTEYKYPVMVHLIENIEAIALPNVTWTVTEMMSSGSPASFPEKVF